MQNTASAGWGADRPTRQCTDLRSGAVCQHGFLYGLTAGERGAFPLVQDGTPTHPTTGKAVQLPHARPRHCTSFTRCSHPAGCSVNGATDSDSARAYRSAAAATEKCCSPCRKLPLPRSTSPRSRTESRRPAPYAHVGGERAVHDHHGIPIHEVRARRWTVSTEAACLPGGGRATRGAIGAKPISRCGRSDGRCRRGVRTLQRNESGAARSMANGTPHEEAGAMRRLRHWPTVRG